MTDSKGKYVVAGEPEPQRGRLSNLCRFLYNSDEGKFLGRTGGSWLKIFVFYVIYYCCLAGFFAGMLSVFLFGVIKEEAPHLTGDHSLLKMNPGLGFRPQPEVDYTLIEFTAGKPETYKQHVDNLMQLYNQYKAAPDLGNQRSDCGPDAAPDNQPDKVCPFNWEEALPSCSPANDFGFGADNGQPCVVLKLNRIFGWTPDPIDAEVQHPLVECHGENPADAETIGQLEYYPSTKQLSNETSAAGKAYGYFSQAYFPYLKQPQYQPPLVGVQFVGLRPNTLVMVECRLRNLRGSYYSKMDRQAMVRFEIFMRK